MTAHSPNILQAALGRFKSILGISPATNRSQFIFTPGHDDLQVCACDITHHFKYFNRGGYGRTELLSGLSNEPLPEPRSPFTPSPMTVVSFGIEPLKYLDQFGTDSIWYADIQKYKAELIINEVYQ